MNGILSKIKNLSKIQVLTGSVISGSFTLLYFSGWKPLSIQKIGGGHGYVDLKAVTHAAECYKSIGPDVFTVKGDCSYQYGLFLLKLINFLHMNSLSTFQLGGVLFFAVALLLIAIGAATTQGASYVVINSLILLSPGVWLLFERGNFDLLIIIFLAMAVATINTKYSFAGAILLVFTVLMKFYTFPLLFVFVLIERKIWLKIVLIITCISIIPFIVSDIIRAPGHPNPMYVAFGIPLPGLWVNFFAWRFNVSFELGMLAQYLVGFLIFFSVFFAYRYFRIFNVFKSEMERISFTTQIERNIFLFSSIVYVSCFLAGSNFDYRLIFLSISLVMLNKQITRINEIKILVMFEISALWCTYFYFGATGPIPVFLSIFGNLTQLILAVVILVKINQFVLPLCKLNLGRLRT